MIEKFGMIISLSDLRFKLFTDISKAADPLETAIPYFLPIYFYNFFSKNFTSGPSDEIHPEEIDFETSVTFFFDIKGMLTGKNLLFDFNFIFIDW